MFEPETGQIVVAVIHFGHHPLQCFGSFLGVGNNRGDQVRNTLVGRQLHPFRVNQHHAHLIRGGAHQNGGNHRVDETRLSGACRTSNQNMGHFGEVCRHKPTLDVFTDTHHHGVRFAAGLRRAQHIPQGHNVALDVGNFHANGGFSWNGRQNSDFVGCHRVGNVFSQLGNALDFDASAQFNFVAGH